MSRGLAGVGRNRIKGYLPARQADAGCQNERTRAGKRRGVLPLYLDYRRRTKTVKCKNKDKDGKVCGKEFQSSHPSAKYCEECRKKKPWYGDHIKRL